MASATYPTVPRWSGVRCVFWLPDSARPVSRWASTTSCNARYRQEHEMTTTTSPGIPPSAKTPSAAPAAGAPAPSPAPPSRNPMRIVARVVIFAAVLAGGYYIWKNYVAPPKIPGSIVPLSGRIEGDDSAVAPKTAGRIVEIRFREGDSVKAGDTIAV